MKKDKKDQTKNVGEHRCYTEQEVEIPVVQQQQDGDKTTTIKLFGTWTRPTTATAKTSTGAASAANDDAVVATGHYSSNSGRSGTNVMVIFVGGSGPLDRDENVGAAQKLNVCNVLARALATPSSADTGGGNNDRTGDNGMASFRYDKRGAGKSTGNYMHAGVRDLLDDLLAVMDYCANTLGTAGADDDEGVTSTRRLILVGHSEGTILSAMACLERPQLVQALVLICSFVQNLEDVLLRQGRLIDDMIQKAKGCSGWCQRSIARCFLGEAGVKGQQAKVIQRIKDSGEAPTIRHMFHTLPARWLRDHFALDNAAIYRNVGRSGPACSTLLLVAGSDVQCDPADGARIQRLLLDDEDNVEDNEGKGDLDRPKQVDNDDDGKGQGRGTTHELITIANLSHLLRREDEHKEDEKGFAGYGKQLKMDIDPELVTTVVDYCRRQQSIPKQQHN
jgi:pimeloyl-ACP methyl ester carboxylesterase